MTSQAQQLFRLQSHGATLLVLPDDSLPLVRFAIGLRHGALVDPAGKAGRGRVMLDLLTRGTEQHDRRTWNAKLERLGTQLGVSMASDLGLLHGVTLERHFEATLDLVTEALLRPALADAERRDLTDELKEQLESERDDDEALLELFWRRALYPGHPLWRRPAGEPAELEALSSADIRAAHDTHLTPAELIIACTGDLTPQAAEALFAPLLTALPKHSSPNASVPSFPQPQGLELWVVDKPERTQAQLAVGCLALSGADPDMYAFWLGTTAFGGTFTSQFTREVRDMRGWSYSAHAELARRRPYKTPLALKTAPAIEDAVDCLELELGLYAKLAAGELLPGAVDFARAYLVNRHPLELATTADLLVPALRNELLGLAPEELFRVPERLCALDGEAVSAALSRHLDPAHVLGVMVATADKVVNELRERFPTARVRVVDFRDDGCVPPHEGAQR